MHVLQVLGIAAIPGTLAVAAIKMMFSRFVKINDERDKNREKRDFLLYKGITASIGLSATMAEELAEKNHVNGKTHEYAGYAVKAKHDLDDFYAKLGAGSMN